MKKIFLFFLVMPFFTFAQQINSANISFSGNNIVKAVADVYMPQSPCFLTNSSLEFDVNQNILTLKVYYGTDTMPIFCSRADTFSLGVLPVGQYTLMLYSFYDDGTQVLPQDFEEVPFEVFPVSSFAEGNENSANLKLIYGFKESVLLLSGENIKQYLVKVYAIDGREILKKITTLPAEISLAGLSKGPYIVQVLNSKFSIKKNLLIIR